MNDDLGDDDVVAAVGDGDDTAEGERLWGAPLSVG